MTRPRAAIGSAQADPEGRSAQHKREHCHDQQQNDDLPVNPAVGCPFTLVMVLRAQVSLGSHDQIITENARNTVITISATMITSSNLVAVNIAGTARDGVERGFLLKDARRMPCRCWHRARRRQWRAELRSFV